MWLSEVAVLAAAFVVPWSVVAAGVKTMWRAARTSTGVLAGRAARTAARRAVAVAPSVAPAYGAVIALPVCTSHSSVGQVVSGAAAVVTQGAVEAAQSAVAEAHQHRKHMDDKHDELKGLLAADQQKFREALRSSLDTQRAELQTATAQFRGGVQEALERVAGTEDSLATVFVDVKNRMESLESGLGLDSKRIVGML